MLNNADVKGAIIDRSRNLKKKMGEERVNIFGDLHPSAQGKPLEAAKLAHNFLNIELHVQPEFFSNLKHNISDLRVSSFTLSN